jgi:DNA polymerase type B, organellar and viral
LEKELIKYCEQDVITLHQVITKFSEEVFKMFKTDIHSYPTLSSLAFAIYRSTYLKDEKLIPLIYDQIFKDIKSAYTGGTVDVINPQGDGIFGYDINSLYPFVMLNYPMPVGSPVYFEGDITLIEKKPFGFFEVEVIAPEGLNIPILQTIFKSESGGNRTISPLGNWKG